ncbi:MAG: diaminopimelate epimerase [Oscillospiraceae bacterium]|nr:diaminopimelate epimerase [Oscillospiraceae bacterium]
MKFTKMHGAGNDFIIINAMQEQIAPERIPELARVLCSRRTGIGADGLMLTDHPTDGGDFKLLFYNADGSLGEMCGNGARCIARYGYEHGLSGDKANIETTAGLVTGERISETQYRIRLNDPGVIDLHRPACGFDCSYIELGNPGIPHAVVMVDDWDKKPEDELRGLGRSLRFNPAFPKGANVSFAKLTGSDCIKAITYERGVEDFTLACGTGSGSIAAVASLKGLVSGGDIRIQMPGGDLYISLTEESGRVRDIFLTGPTCVVFTGETYLV